MTEPRGYRNHNPGNLRRSGEQWVGEVPSTDPAFKAFADLPHGIRAAARLILNYHNIHKLQTVEVMIHRWAPPSDNNDTPAYGAAVAKACGVDPRDRVEMPAKLLDFMRAVFRQENGKRPDGTDWVSDDDLRAGCALAMRH